MQPTTDDSTAGSGSKQQTINSGGGDGAYITGPGGATWYRYETAECGGEYCTRTVTGYAPANMAGMGRPAARIRCAECRTINYIRGPGERDAGEADAAAQGGEADG